MASFSPVIPVLRYRDAHAAIAFLEEAFGLHVHMIHEEDGRVGHAQLTWRSGMVMLGTDDGEIDRATIYVVVDDVEAHHARAVAAGATIEDPPTSQDYGGSSYIAVDPEGHTWSFGDYEPA